MHIATLMLLGSGELGREFAIAAKRLGCRVIACDRYDDAPAMQVAETAMREVGVTRQYTELFRRAQAIPFLNVEAYDLDRYVEQREQWDEVRFERPVESEPPSSGEPSFEPVPTP